MKTNEEIIILVQTAEQAVQAVIQTARHQYKPKDCPLNVAESESEATYNHYGLFERYFGCGQWRWTCAFCGEEFEE